ncbi:uncharacterized protein LTR77_000626 [Saxophila tyrrhenica]|uniref:Myb-like domain-containing protein n=1 Tax=Saxophila tyrrhenica TaxID=1690608 RepID=A0AAV9PNU8_9PEZI|nr:hypothetical protein LTR77_000626 [Saxophila tyrrhenica]
MSVSSLDWKVKQASPSTEESASLENAVQSASRHMGNKTNGSSNRKRKRQSKADKDRGPAKTYRRIFEETLDGRHTSRIQNVHRLPPSHIGGAYWSEHEKDAFFSALAIRGPDDLPGLSKDIGTKSQAEVRAYVLLLRDQYHRTDSQSPALLARMADIPAPHEVDDQCESLLDTAADSLARETFLQEAEVEQARFGSRWLIDNAVMIKDEDEADIKVEEDATPDYTDKIEDDDERETVDSKPQQAQSPFQVESQTSTTTDNVGGHPLSELLATSSFIALSQTLFMNSSNRQDNWQTMDDTIDSHWATSPAMFRSALDDFHDITVQITRKLVHATLLQAMSRIRAKDTDNAPEPLVTKTDARTAADILGMKDWKIFWATVPRRCSVEVYTEEKKFRDGRQSSKTGVRLTYDEVEAALGMDARQTTGGTDSYCIKDEPGSYEDSDGSAGTDGSRDENSDEGEQEVDVLEFELKEDQAVDSQDVKASKTQTLHLLDRLGWERSSSEDSVIDLLSDEEPPARTRRGDSDWRGHTKYEPGWERASRLDEL